MSLSSQVPVHEELKRLLREANYDEALAKVSGWDLRSIVQVPDELSRLRFRCMISDVLDYGGRYADAEFILHYAGPKGPEHIGKIAEKQLRGARDIDDLRDPVLAKQQCWALILWGMTYYRLSNFDVAVPLFRLAQRIATILHNSSNFRSLGTLARAYYCIGLVHREKRDSKQARAAFREAIELAGKGIQDRKARNESTVSFEFNMARCIGLGMGWIAYNEALLTEAATALAIGRCMMIPSKAKLVSAYIDTVQATIIMSESADLPRIREALRLLKEAHSAFAPPGRLQHTNYTLRCENKIALAYLRLAIACTDISDRREENLHNAELYVEKVKTAAKLIQTEQAAYCTADYRGANQKGTRKT